MRVQVRELQLKAALEHCSREYSKLLCSELKLLAPVSFRSFFPSLCWDEIFLSFVLRDYAEDRTGRQRGQHTRQCTETSCNTGAGAESRRGRTRIHIWGAGEPNEPERGRGQAPQACDWGGGSRIRLDEGIAESWREEVRRGGQTGGGVGGWRARDGDGRAETGGRG